eukprot:76344_1
MNCVEDGICQGAIFTCRPGDDCQIICDANETCSDIIINGNNATDVTVLCSSAAACTNQINTICGTGLCAMQCERSDSCLNVMYSSTVTPASSQCDRPSFYDLLTEQSGLTGLMIASGAMIICCALMVFVTVLNCTFYRRNKRKEQAIERLKVHSQSRASMSVATPSLHTQTTSAVLTGARPRAASVTNSAPYHYQPRTSSAYKYPVTPLPTTPCEPNAENVENGGGSSFPDPSTYTTLPLSMKIPEFEIRVSMDPNTRPGDSDNAHQSSGSSSESNRL